MKKEPRYLDLGIKRSKKVFHTTSGALIGLRQKKNEVIKIFPFNPQAGRGNAVYPRQLGRKPGRPITHHEAVNYYCHLMHDAYWKAHSRVYGPPKVIHYRVRPVKLIRSGKDYHVVERVVGPNVDDFISYLRGYKFRKDPNLSPAQQSDEKLRRGGLAHLLQNNRREVEEFKTHTGEFHNEILRQIDWIRSNPHAEGIDLYESNLKESDFVVEGFERDKSGQLRLKLVMVDFQ